MCSLSRSRLEHHYSIWCILRPKRDVRRFLKGYSASCPRHRSRSIRREQINYRHHLTGNSHREAFRKRSPCLPCPRTSAVLRLRSFQQFEIAEERVQRDGSHHQVCWLELLRRGLPLLRRWGITGTWRNSGGMGGLERHGFDFDGYGVRANAGQE